MHQTPTLQKTFPFMSKWTKAPALSTTFRTRPESAVVAQIYLQKRYLSVATKHKINDPQAIMALCEHKESVWNVGKKQNQMCSAETLGWKWPTFCCFQIFIHLPTLTFKEHFEHACFQIFANMPQQCLLNTKTMAVNDSEVHILNFFLTSQCHQSTNPPRNFQYQYQGFNYILVIGVVGKNGVMKEWKREVKNIKAWWGCGMEKTRRKGKQEKMEAMQLPPWTTLDISETHGKKKNQTNCFIKNIFGFWSLGNCPTDLSRCFAQ